MHFLTVAVSANFYSVGQMVGGYFVKEFTADYMSMGSPEYREMKNATTQAARNRLRALRLLRYTHIDNDETSARKVLADAMQLLDDLPESMLTGVKEPRKVASVLYSMYLAGEIKSARLVIHRTERGEFLPVIRCPDLKTALYVFAAYRGVEACLNCGNLFATDGPRPDASSSERYCTAACGQRYRQKLYRLRQKKLKKISKRKAGK
jgi:ribosomal protein S27E